MKWSLKQALSEPPFILLKKQFYGTLCVLQSSSLGDVVWFAGVSFLTRSHQKCANLSKKRINDRRLEVIIARLPSSSRGESDRIYISVFACVKMSDGNHQSSGIMMKCSCLNWSFTSWVACGCIFSHAPAPSLPWLLFSKSIPRVREREKIYCFSRMNTVFSMHACIKYLHFYCIC